VELRRGDAHFTVAKNPERPFRVEAGTVAVRAVGTAFNVRRGASEVEVLVTEGKVEVASEVERVVPNALSGAANAEQARWGQRPPPSVTPLTANQRATVSPAAAPRIEKLEAQTIREVLAWQGPRLTFLDTPLSVVVSQFNRRNAVQLVIRDSALDSLPIGGSFRAENLEAFVRLLEQDNDIIVDRSDATQVILRRRK
jgi:transmembrane sensor